ncbi:MAG: sigma 54-dependent Fis family transcriptional regulator [Myxococcales bacterium]|nr:sigma 54-dependent Fis family transcriptional regulator [Myxococcales bacterium]
MSDPSTRTPPGSTRRIEAVDDQWRDAGRLTWVDPSGTERSVAVVDRPVIVGRDPGCDLTIPDARVSAAHLELEPTPSGVVARDLQTTNGTFAGELRIREVILAHGSELDVGGARLVFTYDDVPQRVERREVEAYHGLVGRSRPMQTLYADIERLAPTPLAILVEGETGTGKELVARAIHAASARSGGPFVVVDCGALTPTLLESTLFGHDKGAFSGAHATKQGLVEAAEGGTLFLDELGELPTDAQTRLLRLLEARTYRRVGSTQERKADIRPLAATHRDIPAMVASGAFRADLFFRLATARLRVPPLRERLSDVPDLSRAVLERLEGSAAPTIEKDALAALARRDWPGNVRELRNALEVASALCRDETIREADLQRQGPTASLSPPALAITPSPRPTVGGGLFRDEKARVLEEFERDYLAAVFEAHDGNVTRAAEEAGIARQTFAALLKRYDLDG